MTDDALLEPLSTPEAVERLRRLLLGWYDAHRRELPWRTSRDPYHVLVSELMLQQTRVDVVLPYFARWVARWPSVGDLAAASEDEVLAAWSGLGYYRRARSLRAAARAVVAEHGGVVPRDPDTLRSLPGVGPYTAAAVASIAYDEPVPVVDGNVERVVCRLLGDDRAPCAARRRTIEEAARRLVEFAWTTGMRTDDGEGLRAGDWNQAMMELGALVCTPRDPGCAVCPWRRGCAAHATGNATDLPRGKPKRPPRLVTLRMAVVHHGARVLLVQRPEGVLLSGMWELPTTAEGGRVADLAELVRDAAGVDVRIPSRAARSFRHSITNRRITVRVHDAVLPASSDAPATRDGIAWAHPRDLHAFGLSSMTRKALAR